jgi:hypothetical protein
MLFPTMVIMVAQNGKNYQTLIEGFSQAIQQDLNLIWSAPVGYITTQKQGI